MANKKQEPVKITPHPVPPGGTTLSPRRGLGSAPSADIAKNAISAPPDPRRALGSAPSADIAKNAISAPPDQTDGQTSFADIAKTAISAPPDEDRRARPVTDVAKLPAELRELVERMLVEGATFEDIYDAVNERGAPLTLQAVQNLYRGSMELQKRRIVFQVERARALTEALGDPESSDAQLAYAAMLTGLQSLNRKDGSISVKEAVKGSMERRNLLLKHDLLRMQIEREEQEKRFRRMRIYTEMLKVRLMRIKLVQLRRELAKHENSGTLGRVAMEKIQEIYGLLQIPAVPREADLAAEEKKL